MSEPEKLDLRSMDIAKERKEKLCQLFPEVFTEDKIDFEKLRLTLGENIEAGKERYGMNWPGKADCFKIIQNPSIGTLKPCPEESVNFDITENLFIEGDNLEVLKLLQKSYYGKVKMIYIDPPYNTGNDFIYPDDYTENLDTYLKYTQQADESGRRFSTNTEDNGRFHSKWLNMMYPRLFLVKNLLREDGVISISIDDNEVANLRKVCDEIFGEENRLAELVWDLGTGTAAGHFTRAHEYIIVYAKDKTSLMNFHYSGPPDTISERAIKKISRGNPASEIAFPAGIDFEGTDAVFEDKLGRREVVKIISKQMIFKDGKLAQPVTLEAGWAMRNQILSWLEGKPTFDSKGQKVIRFYFDKNGRLQYEKERGFLNPQTVLRSIASTRKGSQEIEKLFGSKIMDFPKPVDLLKFLIETIANNDDLVLDYFAGSGGTAHAVLILNQENKTNRKFIMVQLPEACGENSEAFKAGFKTIAEIGKERIRRVIKNIEKEKDETLFKDKKLDLGFKVFKLDKSNFKIWDSEKIFPNKRVLEKQLEWHINHIDPKATQEDILFEILLKAGFELTTKIEKIELTGKTVYSVEDGAMLVCLEKKLTKEVIKAMAEKHPNRVICLDQGFANNDQLKTNAVQIMKSKGVDDFRTV